MKVLVLGASGRLGRALLNRAVATNHSVTAFTRHPGPLLTGDPSVRIFGGSVHDARAVARALYDQDAVIWAVALRPTADRVALPLLHGTRIVVNAMMAAGIARLVYVSDVALYAQDQGGPGARLLRSVLGNPARRESREREAVVQASTLDWTIVRPARLTAGPHIGAYAAVPDLPARPAPIARTDAAAFIVAQLGLDTYRRQTPHLVSHTVPATTLHARPTKAHRDGSVV